MSDIIRHWVPMQGRHLNPGFAECLCRLRWPDGRTSETMRPAAAWPRNGEDGAVAEIYLIDVEAMGGAAKCARKLAAATRSALARARRYGRAH